MELIKEKVFGNIEMVAIFQEEVLKIETVTGIIYGPHTVSFKQYMKLQILNDEVQDQKYDQWRFITILTNIRSYDYMVQSREDALDLIISIADAIIRQKKLELTQKIEKIKQGALDPTDPVLKGQELRNSRNAMIELEQESLKAQIEHFEANYNKRLLIFEFTRRKIK